MERAEEAQPEDIQTAADQSPFPGKQVWIIVVLLFLATVLNYLDRQVLALTAERVMEEFQLTKEDFGKIIAAFRYSYAIFQIIGGWIVDSRGPGLILPLAIGLWSLAGMLTGLVRSVTALASMRFMLGIGEAFNWPCALKVTQRLLPPRDRALANGIFNSGAAAGAILAPILVTFITVLFGWRWAFVLIGSLGFFWIVAWFMITRPMYGKLGGTRLSITQVLRIMRTIVGKRGFWVLAVSAVIINSVYYFMADWIPLYLKTERGFSFAIGNALSVIVYISLEAGNILVGLFIRHLVKRGYDPVTARRIALLLACLLMSCAPFVGFIPSRAMAVFFLMLIALGVASFLVIYLTMVQDLEPRYVGTTAGLLGGLGNLAYGGVSPLIGRLADLQQSFLTFSLIGILPWLAFAAIFYGLREGRGE